MMTLLWLTLRSVWSSGINSPSAVWRDLINLARIWASTIWEFRKSPTLQTELSKIVIFLEWTNLNMNVNFPSRVQITAFFENTIVSVRFFGWDIFTNIHPTMKASTILPKISFVIIVSIIMKRAIQKVKTGWNRFKWKIYRPKSDWIKSNKIASGHLSVIARVP